MITNKYNNICKNNKKIINNHNNLLHQYDILKRDREYPIADVEWLKLITLPCHNGMTDDDIDYVVYWVNKFIEDEYSE